MAEENFLSEEEVSKELGINKAQLEEFVRKGKILPSYKDGMRKFKSQDIEKLKTSLSEVTEVPPVEPPPKTEIPPIAEEVGSTRVIKPPKEASKLRVKKQPTPSEKPDFLKAPSTKVQVASSNKLESILLALSLLVLAFSLSGLYFVWKGTSLPNFLSTIIKSISSIGG